jgi:hypothetical protein
MELNDKVEFLASISARSQFAWSCTYAPAPGGIPTYGLSVVDTPTYTHITYTHMQVRRDILRN